VHNERMTTALLLTFITLLFLALPLHAELSVTFESSGLVVSGITPGGSVVVKGVARVPMGYYVRISRYYDLLTDSDQDGKVTVPGDIPQKSVWAAIDPTTAQFVVAWPEGSPASVVSMQASPMTGDSAGNLTGVTFESGLADVLVTRNGGLIWEALVADGGGDDADGQSDGSVDIPMNALEPQNTAIQYSAPVRYQTGDVVVLIDTEELTIQVVKVNQ